MTDLGTEVGHAPAVVRPRWPVTSWLAWPLVPALVVATPAAVLADGLVAEAGLTVAVAAGGVLAASLAMDTADRGRP